MTNETKAANKNSQKTYYQLSTSSVAGKWESEAIDADMKLRTLKIQIYPNKQQKLIINEWIDTSRYVYNKTVRIIKDGNTINKFNLRNKLVTYKNRDGCINPNINEWEINTPKDVRAGAVFEVCNAHKSASANTKNYEMTYRKKSSNKQTLIITEAMLKFNKDTYTFSLAPTFIKDEIVIGKRTINMIKKKYPDLTINNEAKLTRINNEYYLNIVIPTKIGKKEKLVNYCGVDPGVRTFITTFGNNGCVEYKHRQKLLNKLNYQIDIMKASKKRIRKRAYNKREKRKANIITDFQWKTANDLLKDNDVIFYGNIKSHGIVKNSNNPYLKRNLNDIKHYQMKQKLAYKANINHKIVFFIDESYTTKTCSICGCLNNPRESSIYTCSSCNTIMGRDINAAKNILMKGINQHII
jgi:putative transposase